MKKIIFFVSICVFTYICNFSGISAYKCDCCDETENDPNKINFQSFKPHGITFSIILKQEHLKYMTLREHNKIAQSKMYKKLYEMRENGEF